MRNHLQREAVPPAMKRLAPIALAGLLAACMSHPPPAAAPYRAVGQAADWTLIIDDRFVTFVAAPGQQPVLEPVPQPIVGVAGEIYQTQRINVNIVHGTCSDTHTDRAWPDRVQVTVDGRSYSGCGGL